MENDKIFNLMEKMSIHMQEGFQKVNSEISELKSDVNGLKSDVNGLKSDVNELKLDVNGLKSDVNELKSDVNGLKLDVNELKSDVNGLKQEANKTNTIIENEIKPKIEALFDGYMQNSEKIDTIDRKIDKLQLDVNSLTIRAVNNDTSIINLRNELKVVK